MDSATARERFAAARVARLATVAPDGRPHLVPIVFAVDGDTIYSVVDAKPKRSGTLARLRNVASEPRVSVIADFYDEDWSQLWWARADGLGRVLSDPEVEAESERAIALLAGRYPQQRATGPVLAITVSRWTGWSARGAQ
jgi:PPOX class probable F420-dependent enzyme